MRLLSIPKAASTIGLSRQRVYVLVQKGQILTDPDSGLISIEEIARFKKLKRKSGRPRNNEMVSRLRKNGGKVK